MCFETRITRQSFPVDTAYAGVAPGTCVAPNAQSALVPPDLTGRWRYREMNILPPIFTRSGYMVTPHDNYNIPPEYSMPATEILVIWERHTEET